jgi:hypothetical protein
MLSCCVFGCASGAALPGGGASQEATKQRFIFLCGARLLMKMHNHETYHSTRLERPSVNYSYIGSDKGS